jgi:hypothetical protein
LFGGYDGEDDGVYLCEQEVKAEREENSLVLRKLPTARRKHCGISFLGNRMNAVVIPGLVVRLELGEYEDREAAEASPTSRGVALVYANTRSHHSTCTAKRQSKNPGG